MQQCLVGLGSPFLGLSHSLHCAGMVGWLVCLSDLVVLAVAATAPELTECQSYKINEL